MSKQLTALCALIIFANTSFAMDCTISKYVSKDSADYEILASPEVSEVSQFIDTPITVEDHKYYLKLSSVGLFYAEVRDSSDEVLFISTTDAGSPLGIEIPSIKHILTCNARAEKYESSIDKVMKQLKVAPRSYGESMRFNTNPQAYGAYLEHVPSPSLFLSGCSESQKSKMKQFMEDNQREEAFKIFEKCRSK